MCAVVTLPYNPAGTDIKSIEGVLSNFTAITAQVNGNLDSSNLSPTFLASLTGATKFTPVSTNTSGTITPGAALSVTGANTTQTLPAHTAGQMVQVTNKINGGGALTIAGSSIYGEGLANATSFPLNTEGAAVILLDDGTSWYIVSGRQDTGWQAITSFGTNVSAFSSPAVRLVGTKVQWRGSVAISGSISSGFTICTVPGAQYANSGYTAEFVLTTTTSSSPTIVVVQISSTILIAQSPLSSSTSPLYLAPIHYDSI